MMKMHTLATLANSCLSHLGLSGRVSERKGMNGLKWAVMMGAVLATINATNAQVAFSGSYSQDFNSLPTSGTANVWTNNSTLPGWYAFKGAASTNTTRDGTTTIATPIIADAGTNTTGGIHSYGTGTATDRALGTVGSGSAEGVIALVLQNTTTKTFRSFRVQYTGEQWRDGGATTPIAHALDADFTVQTTVPAPASMSDLISASVVAGYFNPTNIDFASPIFLNTGSGAALDGNAAANRRDISGENSFSLLPSAPTSWGPGQYLVIRWWDNNDAGNDHGLAIDDLTITAFASGACCTSSGCSILTNAACTTAGGSYQGDDSVCVASPTGVAANPPAVCIGSSTQLTATVGMGEEVDWYTGSCGGSLVGNGSTLNITPLAGDTYYARARNVGSGCVSQNCVPVTVTVNPLPATPSVGSGGTICAGASFSLTGTAVGGTSIQWRTGSCSGPIIGTGDSVPVSPALSTTYYARAVNNSTGCLSMDCVEVAVTVVPIPAAPGTSGNTSICNGGPGTTLTATAGANEVVDWFVGACSGSPAFTGTSYTVNPTSTTHYFAKARNTLAASCSGPCVEVVVTVLTNPVVTAGPSPTVSACSGGPYPLNGSAPGAASVLWTTSGTGMFAAATSAVTSYSFSPADVLAGTVTLTLTAQPTAPCAAPDAKSIVVTIEPRPSTSVVDVSYIGLPYGTVVTHPNHPGNFIVGCTAFGDIQSAINSVSGSDVYVGPGLFIGDLTISSHVNLHGAGPGLSTISGAIGGPGATISYSGVINCELDGFTVTRQGNNTTDWNDPNLNSTAISFSGGAGPGCVVHNCEITGNRTGIDINNASGATIRNNRIHFNRTGLIMRNVTDNLTITENEITNNWTAGLVFLDASGGSNSPLQTALGCDISGNNISGNWYAQIVERQTGGSLPLPGTTNLKNFSANWLGTTTPIISTLNSTEPGYAAQIPVAYGGTAVQPAPGPAIFDVCGPASANVDITPMLSSGTDADGVAYGFQGDFSNLTVTSQLAQTGSTGRVQEGNETLADGVLVGASRIENILAGNYLEKPTFSRSATVTGANAGVDPCTGTRGAESVIMPDSGAATLAGTSYFVIVNADDVTFDGLTIDGDNPALTSPFTANGANPDVDTGISAEAPNTADGLIVKNTIVRNIFQFGLALGATGNPARAGRIEHNRIENIPYWAGVLVYDDYYAAIEHNCIVDAWRGVQTNNYYQPKPSGASANISSNIITTKTQAIAGDQTYTDVDGILVNNHYQNASDWTVTGNVITNNTARSAGSHGIQVWSILTAVGVTCSGNAITNFDNGYFVWNCPTSNTVTVSGGTTSGNNTGLFLTNYQPSYLSGAPTALLVSGVAATANIAHGLAVVDDSLSSHSIAHMIVEGCTVTGNSVGGISTAGGNSQLTVRNASSTITGNAYGIYATKGGRVLVEDADLRGNSTSGIQIGLGTRVDAGDCTGSNFSGLGTGHGALGSSHGGNNLSGYVFNDATPWAIQNLNSPNTGPNAAYAQNNNFGATTGDDLNDVLFDHEDAAPFATIFASQSGGQGIQTQPVNQSACLGSSVTFTVVVNGFAHYQWYFGATPVGLDQNTYTIAAASLSDIGNYHVDVTDVCNNLTSSNTVSLFVQPGPSAMVGGPYSTCDVTPVAISGTSGNAASVLWTTSGSGIFASAISPSTTYTPSAADVTAGSVTLTFHVLPVSPCAIEAAANANLSIQSLPTVAAGGPYTRCVGAGVFSIVGSSTHSSQVTWTSTGSGTFGNIHAAATTYTPSPADETMGGITLTLTADAILPCTTSAASNATLTFQTGPVVTIGGPYYSCGGVPIAVSATATNSASHLWTSSGTGTFGDATMLATTYTPSPADVTAGSVTLTLTAQPVAPCSTQTSMNAIVNVGGATSVTYVDDGYIGLPSGTQVAWPFGGGGPLHTIGCDAFATIQGGINGVLPNGNVLVASGTYNEDVSINKTAHVLGAGPGQSIVVGQIGGSINTFEIIGQPNVELAGFTITRAGNAVATWNGALNNNGVIASSSPNLSLHNNRIEGNRNGLNLQFMAGASIRNNVITNNRTGVQCVDNVTSSLFTENEISNNWTVGVLFRDETPGGSDTTGTVFTNNTITANWYGQLVYRNPDGHGFTTKNFSGNWLGTISPVATVANSIEPGYAAQIPVAYGGSAVPPGGQPDIAGDASGNFDITPLLTAGGDTNVETMPLRGTYGFQGDFSDLTVTTVLAQTGAVGRIQEGNNLASDGALTGGARLVQLLPGSYKENPTINKPLTLRGSNAGTTGADLLRLAESTINTSGNQNAVMTVTASAVTIDGVFIDGDDTLLSGVTLGSGEDTNASYGVRPTGSLSGLTVKNSIIKRVAIGFRGDGASSGNLITRNLFDSIGFFDFGYAVSLRTEFYADVTDNVMTRVWTGLHANDHHLPGAPAAWLFTGNEVHSYAAGLCYWLNYNDARGMTVSNNAFTAEAGAASNNFGILVVSLQSPVSATFTGNTVTGHQYGIGLFNTPTSATVSLGSTNSIANASKAGVFFTNNLNFNPVGTTNFLAGGPGAASNVLLNGLPITGSGGHGVLVDASGGTVMNALITGNTSVHGTNAAGSTGVKVSGALASATIINNPASLTTSEVGILIDGGSVLVQNTNVSGNSAAGIRVVNNGRCDAGDCAGLNISGLGTGTGLNNSSAGLNNLSGYGFDGAAPDAVDNLNTSGQSPVRAQNNNYGATVNDDIETLLSDNSNGGLSHIFASQSGGPQILTGPASASVCPGTNVTFTVTAYGQNHYQWFFGANPVGADAPSYTVNNAGPADVGSYHVVVTDDCGNSDTSASAALSILPVAMTASSATSSDNNYCSSAAPATITLTAIGGSGTTFTWYGDSCGGTPIGTGPILATVPGPTATTTYYGSWSTSCGSSGCVSVTVTVNPSPSSAPTVPPTGSVCSGGSFNLTGTVGVGEIIDWYDACGGTLLGSGSPFPVSPVVNTTYFAKARNTTTNCSSVACAAIAVSIVPGPTVDAGSDVTNCAGAVIALSGTAANHSTSLWTSSGTGVFGDATLLATTYTPSPADITAGTVTLLLTVQPNTPCTTQQSDSLIVTIIGPPTTVYVDDGYVGLPNGTSVAWPYPGAPGGPYTIGCNAFATVQGGVNGVLPNGAVLVAAGSYVEDVNASKTVSILGSGPTSVVSGAIGGDGATFRISANNVVVSGFTITRVGNNVTDWNNPGLNSAGVAIQGLAITGAVIRDNVITGNRSGIDINNSGGHTIRNNQIVDNRTGLIFRNTTDGITVAENDIANNWTVGIVFLDGSGGTNSPVQSANGSFYSNNLSGNWYGQIVDRQLGGSLPAPGSILKNFSGNWYGTASPVISSANSAEPGYAAQIPVAFGGSAVPPGGQPDILGPASANFDATPWLNTGTDSNVSAFADTFAFQGDFSSLTVTSQLAQTGSTGRVQEGHNLATIGGTVAVLAGSYSENISITKRLTIDGAGAGDCDTAADPLTQTVVTALAPATPVFDIVDVGGSSAALRLTLKDMRITGASGTADGLSSGVRVSAASGQTREFYRFENLTVTGNTGHGIALGSVGTINNVEIASSNICSNYRGIVVDDTLTAFNGLALSGSIVKNNAFHGLSVSGTASGSFSPTNIAVSSSTFSSNGQSNNLFQGSGDLSFFYFNGNASLTGVTVHTTGRVPVQFRGRGTDNFSIPWAPAGTITINGLSVDGVSDRSALYMHYYANVDSVSLNNVDLSGVTSSAAAFSAFAVPGMTLVHLGANPLPLGNTIFPCQGSQSAGYVGLALLGPGGANADCTTVFVGASTLAQKEDCVFDVAELNTVGDVTFLDAAVTSGPSNASACLGTPASFTVTTVGSGLSYQWYHNNLGSPVGANSAIYSIPAVALTDAGTYFVVVTGACGPVTSSSATLSITSGPTPAASASVDTTSICTGSGPATITLTAIGGTGDDFTWYEGGCGAGSPVGTGSSITIPAPGVTTTYFGRWSTICGSSSCVSATVTHVAPPTANAGGSYTICANGVVQLAGVATNFDHVLWTTTGDGFYHNASILNAVYTPGANDIANGSVVLTFTAYPNAPCSVPAVSTATVTINPLPVPPASASVDTNNFCSGTVPNITLTAVGGSGTKLSWSVGACGGPIVGSGPVITIAAPTSTKTYYARWINGCGVSTCAEVTVTVNDLPSPPILGASGGICSGQPFTLTGSVNAGETIDWFDAGCGSGPVGSGTSVVVNPTTTTTYFARARNTSTGCISSGCQTLTVTVTTTPTAPTGAIVDSPAYCSGSAPANITLTASGGSGGTYHWYTGSCGGTHVGTGNSLVLSAPGTSTTYYVRREDGSCLSSSCASVSVTVTPTPTSPTSAGVDVPAYCSSAIPATITLTATGGTGGIYHWYSGSCGGTPVGTGSPLAITAPTSTTTYYVRRVDGVCNSTACLSVTVTVNASPVAPTGAAVDNASFCEGAVPSISLTASGGSGDLLHWYSGSCGGTPVGTGSPLLIPSPIASTTYFARWESTLCGNSACESVSVHVDPSAHQPTGINASANNYCAGSVTTLTLTAVAGSGTTLEWFEGSCGGSPIGTGNPLVIPAPITTKTYFARYNVAICGPSPCASVTITVNPVTGACCTGWGTQKVCAVVDPIFCQGVTTPVSAYRGNCTTCGTPFCCGADYNNNGHIEVQDIFDYLNAWFAQVPSSDFNHDGFKNIQDIFDFLSAWFAGC